MNSYKISFAIIIGMVFILKLLFVFKEIDYPMDGIAWAITLIIAIQYLAEGLEENKK